MAQGAATIHARDSGLSARARLVVTVVLLALAVAAPFVFYPVFMMKVLCFALFACAFNLLIGYVGLLSFGHAMFLGTAGYVAAHTAKMGLSIDGVKLFSIAIPLSIHLPPFPPEFAILTAVACSTL